MLTNTYAKKVLPAIQRSSRPATTVGIMSVVLLLLMMIGMIVLALLMG